MPTEDHICTQQAKIGAIEAILQCQSDADSRIEHNLTDLVKAVQENQISNQSEFKVIAANFAKMETILADQKAAINVVGKDQKDIKTGLEKLADRVTTVEATVKTNSDDINKLNAQADAADERIGNIEKWIIRIVAIITALGLVIEFLSNIDSVKKFFFPEVHQVQQVETQK